MFTLTLTSSSLQHLKVQSEAEAPAAAVDVVAAVLSTVECEEWEADR